MLAILFAWLLIIKHVAEIRATQPTPSHYAAPAVPGVDKQSSVAIIRVTADGGW